MAGKLLTLLGALLAILTIALFYVMPTTFAWWGVAVTDASTGLTTTTSIGGISSLSIGVGGASSTGFTPVLMYVLIEGILIIIGALIAILGALKESKGLGMLGGLLILAGPILLIVQLLMPLGTFFSALSATYTAAGMTGTLIMGSYEWFGSTFAYGLQVGAYLLIASGVLALIGGMTISD